MSAQTIKGSELTVNNDIMKYDNKRKTDRKYKQLNNFESIKRLDRYNK